MTDDLRALYQEVIIDHSKNPRNFGTLEKANCQAEGVNPLCGDELNLECYLDEQEVIQDIKFVGRGCAVSIASASIMTDMLKGMHKDDAEKLFRQFHYSVTSKSESSAETIDIGKLEVLTGVREFPTRVKCATLAWHTAMSALNESGSKVSTE